MKKLLRFALLALAFALLALSLTACGGTGGTAEEEQSEYVYLPSYTTLDTEDIDYVEGVTPDNDGHLYFYTYGVVGRTETLTEQMQKEVDEYYNGVPQDWMYEINGYLLYRVNMDGTGLTKLENFVSSQPEAADGIQSNSNIERMTVDEAGNLALLESVYSYTFDAEGNYQDMGNSYLLRTLDSTGAEIGRVDLKQALSSGDDYMWISALSMDGNGNIYLSDGNSNTLYVFDNQGAKLFSLTADSYVENIYVLKDGRVGTTMYADNGYVLKLIDVAAKDWGDVIPLPDQAWNLYVGGGDYDLYYNDGSNLYGFSLATQKEQVVLNWIDSDVDTNSLNQLTVLPDSRVFCVMNTYTNSGNKTEFVTLTKTPRDQVPVRTELTLAAYYLDSSLRTQVVEFNKTNTEYRIVVKEYNIYNNYDSEDGYDAGLTKMMTELVSGQVPDIICTNSLPMERFASRDMLEDLWPYIDNDGTITRADLVESALNALCDDEGKLYQIGPGFSVSTVFGSPSLVGDEMGWTIGELNALMQEHPGAAAFSYWDQSTALQNLCLYNIDQFIDWKTGECRFDSEDFIGILNFAATFPAEIDWSSMDEGDYVDEGTLIKEGKVLLQAASLGSIDDYIYAKANFGGAVTAIGYPSAEGVGNRISMDTGLAMTSSCQYKDVAWSFMRTLLTKSYQEENFWWGFPTNRKLMEDRFTEAMRMQSGLETSGDATLFSSKAAAVDVINGVEIGAPTQADVDAVKAIIDSVSGTFTYNTSSMDIIMEEAAAFFAGQKSAADTAALIQSRMSIYISEQM